MSAAHLRRRQTWTATFVRGAAAALVFAAALATLPVQAQGGGGLILMPENDGVEVPQPTDASPFTVHGDPERRHSRQRSSPTDSTELRWISPLRLVDLSYPITDGVTRIAGERELVNFDLYSAAIDMEEVLQIATISGINNLPERSHMRVSLNGQELGTRNLTHIADFGVDEFIIPPGILRAGRNRVQIEFRQQHRIFCGPQASYDLWSDLDLSRSGLLIRHDPNSGRVNPTGMEGFIMALAAQSSNARAVEIRGVSTLGTDAEIWRDFLVRGFNQALAGTPLLFDFTDYWTTQSESRDHARITIIPANESDVRFVQAGDGAIVMVLEVAQGTRPEDLLSGIHTIEAQQQDLRPALIVPETDVPFSEFGIESESFSQRYAIRSHPFRLPDDWLVLTAAKSRIYLDYAYATDLPEGAMLLLKVNGTTIRLLPLRGEGGVPIPRFPIDFEARLLNPGTNVLSFELFVPGDPPTLPCASGDKPVLQIANSSTLKVPYSPSMFMPDMNLAFSALSPDSLRLNEMSGRAYAQMDILTLKAALARTRTAIRPSVLHLISIDDLGSIPTGHYIADRRYVEDALLQSDQTDALVADLFSSPQGDPFMVRRVEQRSVSLALSSGWAAVIARAKGVFERVFPSSEDHLNKWLADQRGQALLFQLDVRRPDEIWMLRGPDSDMHAIAHAITRARAAGDGPRGQVAVLTHDGHWKSWSAPDRRLIMLEPWSRANFRYAAGNIVSARPIFFTIMMLGLSVISALVALRLVISTREHNT